MESIIHFRQMMAEQKYFEVQKLVEAKLLLESSARLDLLKVYLDVLKAQEKTIPLSIVMELIDEEMRLDHYSEVLSLVNSLGPQEQDKQFLKLSLVKLKIFELSGRMEDLYSEMSSLLIKLFEKQIPVIPIEVKNLSAKFFKNDFHLNLLQLSFALSTNNIEEGEGLVRNLILNCYERTAIKGIKGKLNAISEVLKSARDTMPFRMYQIYCEISVNGVSSKAEYKRLVELVIYFDDFLFQSLILNLLDQSGLHEIARVYSREVKNNSGYNFVYFDKYFPHLKKFFIKEIKTNKNIQNEEKLSVDLTLEEKYISAIVPTEVLKESIEGEELIKSLIRYQDFTSDQLCDLAVGFIQSNMPDIARLASREAIKHAVDSKGILKGSYLKLNSELMLHDYRAALDTALEGLSLATTKDDILSFMYGQAEALIRLDDKSAARKVLKKILEIDAKYRLAKERLEKLNEI